MRGLFAHYPLVLLANEEDWGPRLSRMLKCSKDIPGYNLFVKDKWNSLQSHSVWLEEGDANIKYFHSIVASCRLGNAISFIQVDIVTLEGVNPIRQAVVSHFESHFKATTVERPGADNLAFKRLNQFERSSLTTPFTAAEVKVTVWDCDSY
ncbi:hypothetical protein TSUD_281810 [Trifolium subterraneum]|uniref:Uncharacterized protein n=1 Tax=Trifolium subterraneum TaxID=3900 RepID=A0A2Z6P2F1_TRISU|nr:hypothetical protein TSUD_281810 [Trifolium subterraneum]